MKRKLMPGRNFERGLFTLDSHFTLVLVYVWIVTENLSYTEKTMTEMVFFVWWLLFSFENWALSGKTCKWAASPSRFEFQRNWIKQGVI
jgi:hypothetical protein